MCKNQTEKSSFHFYPIEARYDSFNIHNKTVFQSNRELDTACIDKNQDIKLGL